MPVKEEISEYLKEYFPQSNIHIEAVGNKTAIVRTKVGEQNLRPGGTISGPTMMAAADAGIYVAILGEIGLVGLAVTTNFSINFLRKPKAGLDIICKCKLIKIGKVLIVAEVAIYSEGNDDMVAHAVGTYSVPPKK